ncbi:hypothetical protein JCM16303_001091 [Sporobolomyces ruberrimus]
MSNPPQPRSSFLMSTTQIPPYNPSTSNSTTNSASNSRASSQAGRSDNEDSANDNDEDDSEDFLEPDDLEEDPDRSSSASLNQIGPATPKSSHNWPFTALTINSNQHPGTFPDGHHYNTGASARRRTSAQDQKSPDAMNQDPLEYVEGQDLEGGGPPHIPASSLPHEILLHILRLLPPTALAPALRVCKAWCQCGVELLWHKPMFASLPALYKMLEIVANPSTQTFPYPKFVKRINFSNLTEEMNDNLLVRFMPCTRIERLTLTGCKNLTSESMVPLLRETTRLVALDLSEVEEVDDEVVGTLAEFCPRLQGLNLTGCHKVTTKGMEKLARGCPALRRIKLRKCDLVMDVSIVLLSLHCPLLLEVDLGLCNNITSTSLQQLLRTSHNLRELCLNGCHLLTDDGFPDATSLSLVSSHHSSSYSSNQASPLGSDSDSSSNNPSRSSSPGPSPLTAPSGTLVRRPLPLSSPPPLHSFDHLRYLDLTSLNLLSDSAIAGIVKFMPKIRNLILAKCTRLTDESLYEICKIGKHLHYLHLGHVNSITDKAVTAIARNCTRLRYIDLACCNNLTDISVLELASNLPRLKRIGLVRVTNITDASLDALHARTSLERIHLSYCSNLTVAGVNDLLQHLPRLTHLSLTEVHAFRKKALQVFCRPPPKDFNDHQRRSFCVFSGRGVHDLRRYLRSLSPFELEALSEPDPPSEDDATRLGNRGLGQQVGAGGGLTTQQLMAHRQQQQQHRQQNPLWRMNLMAPVPANGGGGQGGGGGQTTAQIAQARARLNQIAQARPLAHRTGPPAHGGGGGGTGLGAAFDPNPTQGTLHDNRALLQRQRDEGGAAGGSDGRSNSHRPTIGFARPGLDRQNSLGLSGPVGLAIAREAQEDDEDEGMRGTIPIQSVPAASTSMDVDDSLSHSGPSTSSRPPRPRRATVTRTNYRSASSSHRRGGGSGMDDDEEDDDGEATGEEEDLTMAEA